MLLLWMPSERVYTILFISYQSNEFASRCGFFLFLSSFSHRSDADIYSFHHSLLFRIIFFCRAIKLHFHLILDLIIDENYACRLVGLPVQFSLAL